MNMHLPLIALTFLLLSSFAFAQSIDRALLVSDATSADMLIAKAAGEKTGAPVFILENGTLTDDVKAELISLGIKTVILIGGPAVISAETEDALEKSFTVVRLWGLERTGTAVETARYFWSEGASCAVLAEDTKDSEEDTELQTDASQLAAAGNCPMLPVPKGKMPSEVAAILSAIGASHATFIGTQPDEFRAKLSHLKLKEIIGERQKEIESEITNKTRDENGTLRLLIIAAPHWHYVLGHGGHAGRHTIVRIASSVDAVPKLVTLINSLNITYVKVIGHPALAQDIAGQLNASGIIASKISGERASEVAIKAVRESWERWQERRKHAFGNETRAAVKSAVKRQTTAMVNKLESDLNMLENDLAKLEGANGTAVLLLQKKIDNAQSQIGAIRDYISNDNLDTAKRRTARLQNEVRRLRWLLRHELRIDAMKEVAAEES